MICQAITSTAVSPKSFVRNVLEIQASVSIFVWRKRSLDSLFGGPTGSVVDDICFERGFAVWSLNEREVRLEVISPWVAIAVSCALEMADVDAVD